MNLLKTIFFALTCTLVFSTAQAKNLDQIAIVVDQGVILESEVQEKIQQFQEGLKNEGRTLPSESALRVQVTERLILESLQLQMAEQMGIIISDAELDQVIAGIAADNNISSDSLRFQIEQTGQSWRTYREEIRKQILTTEVQRMSLQRRIYMSPQEIEMLVQMIEEQGDTQTEFQLGHILARVQDDEGNLDVDASRKQADSIIKQLEAGGNFQDISIAASSASNALEGGGMGWLSLNAMPTLFTSAVQQSPQKGAIIGPLRSGIGFHVLKIHDIRGQDISEIEEVRARHILIKPSVILSNEKAKQQLIHMKAQIVAGEESFEALAKAHSADIGSAQNGGELGFAVSDIYVPEFKRQIDTLEIGQISEPFRTEHGWHITEVLERRVQDVTEQRLKERAQQILFARKYQEELDIWLKEIRDAAYIEFKKHDS